MSMRKSPYTSNSKIILLVDAQSVHSPNSKLVEKEINKRHHHTP